MTVWELLAQDHPGWTLTEIKNLTSRERKNWRMRAIQAHLSRGGTVV